MFFGRDQLIAKGFLGFVSFPIDQVDLAEPVPRRRQRIIQLY